MMSSRNIMFIVSLLLTTAFLAGNVQGDWDLGDPHKMHFPQLPDPDGWDVAFSTKLADDWKCSETGPVEDIHFWISWQADDVLLENIGQINALIYEDDRSGPFSKPAESALWGIFLLPTSNQFSIRPDGQGDQGWYDPFAVPPVVLPNDHQQIYQVNIHTIPNPFIQEEGKIYWLELEIKDLQGEPLRTVGWKTSLNHFEDDAVYRTADGWAELRDPISTEVSLDLAFVITPEPVTLVILALGLIPALMMRRRKTV